MGKRKKEKERDEDYIKRKIRKLQKMLRENSTRRSVETDQDLTPPQKTTIRPPPQEPALSQQQSREATQPAPSHSSPSSASSSPRRMMPHDNDFDLNAGTEPMDDELPEEFLLALGTEGQEQTEVGDPIRPELASRWKKIMNDGLVKEARETIIKKYPTPANFPAAVAPIINPEIHATLSEPSFKRDKRIVSRQNLTGTLTSCLGKCLTNVMKGNINTRTLVEETNDAAKLAAEMHYHDTSSRKFFCLSGATKTIQDAIRQQKTDKFLFGEDCAEKIKAAQTIQKTCNTIKNNTENEKKQPRQSTSNKFKQLNWKSPPQYDQQTYRARGGKQHRQPRKHYNQPHRKERRSYKQRSRHQR